MRLLSFVLWGSMFLTPGLAYSVPSWAATEPCLNGSAAADDAVQAAAARAAVESACPCVSYDGGDHLMRSDYLKCAKGVLKTATQAVPATLRKACASRLLKVFKNSTCGVPAAVDAHPCLATSNSTGEHKCKIKARGKCTSSAAIAAVVCDGQAFCVDAADSTGDLQVDAADDGQCATPVP